MDIWSALLVAAFGATVTTLLGVAVYAARQRLKNKEIVVETVIARGPITQSYGFPEPAIQVTLNNASGVSVGIADIRLRLNRHVGLPLPHSAPPPRQHPTLPTTVRAGSSATWYFPAEQASRWIRDLSPPKIQRRGRVRVRVVLTENNGRRHNSPTFPLTLDPNAH